MDHHTEPVLALPDASTIIPPLNIQAAKESTFETPLRKIYDYLEGNSL